MTSARRRVRCGCSIRGWALSVFLACIAAVAGALAASCGRESSGREVVLYSSVDDYLLREFVPEFEKASGIRVRLVGDTEATKTTGLVQRLLAEKEHPRADVWWSSEPFGTIRLVEEGVLAPYSSRAEKDFEGGWPASMRGADGMWYGFASRGRVLVYNTKKLEPAVAPATLTDLLKPEWKGRVGIARPQFGTTRGHVGALLVALGEPGFRAWVQGMKANGVRVYDGNATVVKAVANGEVDVALTDTDDVYSGQRNGWPVDLVMLQGGDALPVPNTVALVKGAPNPEEAAILIDFILSERVERMLAESESHNTPLRPALVAEFARYALPAPEGLDLREIAARIPEALKIWDEVFGG